ncbi:MAG: 30S ribosomal protein S1, partial [Clostridia bacterium]|nr:30S ribosomal protein S1 [Clostridia bacterium]
MSFYLPEGNLLFTKENRENLSSLAALERSRDKNVVVEGLAVLCDENKNLHVKIGKYEGIVPREEAVYSPSEEIKDIAILTRVGKPVSCLIKDILTEGDKTVLLLSRKAAQEK